MGAGLLTPAGLGAGLHTLGSASSDDRAVAPAGDAPRTEPAIAVDPRNPRHVVVADVDYNFAPDAVDAAAFESFDGGLTWRQSGWVPPAPGAVVTGDPTLAFDSGGRLFFGYISLASYGDGIGGVYVAASPDGGRHWPRRPTPLERNTRPTDTSDCTLMDHEGIGVDTSRAPDGSRRDVVYAAWAHFDLGGTGCPGSKAWLEVSRSTDHGRTWSHPRRVTDGTGYLPSMAVGSDGAVYVPFGTVASRSSTRLCEPGFNDGVGIAFSLDHGRSWRTAHVSDDVCTSPFVPEVGTVSSTGGLYRHNASPFAAVNPRSGTVAITWSSFDPVLGTEKLVVAVSRDRGEHWRERAAVSSTGVQMQMPQLAYGPDGSLWLLAVEQLPGGVFQVTLRRSHDDGATWAAPTTLTSFASTGNGSFYRTQSFIGDYLGLQAGSDGLVHAAWTDNRPSSDPNAAATTWTRALPTR